MPAADAQKIGIVGAGRIGGHDVLISFKRDENALAAFAEEIGARSGSVGDAVAHGEVIVVSVPWTTLDAVAAEVRVGEKVLVDTTNQFAAGGVTRDFAKPTAAEHNARRFSTRRLVKSFNTYTAGFQAEVGDGRHAGPVAMFFGGEDPDTKRLAAPLVRDAGQDESPTSRRMAGKCRHSTGRRAAW